MSSNATEPTAQARRHERMLGILIWLAFAALGVGILWWFSILSGD
jgi:cytoskeletal protein RodZ